MYTADISYLQYASDSFLSAKLARLGLQETARQEPNEPEPPARKPRPPLTVEELDALTAKRREERRARNVEKMQKHMRSYVPLSEKAQVLRAEFEKVDSFMSPERAAGMSAAKRRNERLLRDSHSRVGAEGKGPEQRRRSSRPSNTQKAKTLTPQKPENEIRKPQTPIHTAGGHSRPVVNIDEAVFQPGGHEPEFKGPELPSLNFLNHPSEVGEVTVVTESGKRVKVPISQVDNFVKGDYTPYVTVSAKDFVTPPDVLGVVEVAQRTLSHQRHYSLPARDGIMKVLAQFAQPSSKKPVDINSPH